MRVHSLFLPAIALAVAALSLGAAQGAAQAQEECCCVAAAYVPPQDATGCDAVVSCQAPPTCTTQISDGYSQPSCYSPGLVGCTSHIENAPVIDYDCAEGASCSPPTGGRHCKITAVGSHSVPIVNCSPTHTYCNGSQTILCSHDWIREE